MASTPSCLAQVRTQTSFIARAKEAGDAQVLIGPFTSAGKFDKCLEDAELECTAIGKDGASIEFVVTSLSANNFGTLHGGFISTVVDVVGTLALLGIDPSRAGVSVEMNQSFCSAAKVGERVRAVGTVLRYGRTLGFTEVEIKLINEQGEPGRTVAVGRHTKFFPS